MGCLGRHYAIDRETARLLMTLDDADVRWIIDDLDERVPAVPVFDTGKAWDALHRCLTDGTLDIDGGSYPLSHAVLGGEQCYVGEDYIVALVTPGQVSDVAAALAPLDRAWLHARYFGLELEGYEDFVSEEDFECTWLEGLRGLAEFFRAAAEAGRAVVFTAGQ